MEKEIASVLISRKFLKFNEKIRRKTKSLINKKPPKLDKETKKKTNHLLLYNISL